MRTQMILLHLLPCMALAAPALAQDDEPGVDAAGADDKDDAEDEAPVVKGKKRRTGGLGMAADDTLVSGQSVGINKSDDDGGEWKWDFKGFFRAPMRVGIGSQDGSTQFHSPPMVPDANYTNWAYTNQIPGPWVEMMFQYGNSRAKMTTALASYNITSGGYRELQAQLGIDRAFLTLNFPEALGDIGTLSWNVGVFSDRYGAAGRYDAGMYETYLFGRTRMAGETLRANIYAGDNLTVTVEHGIGAKTDQQKWTMRSVQPAAMGGYQAYEPYPGPVQQGSTLLHHAHVGVGLGDMLTFGAHYINTWTKDVRATAGNPDGKIQVVGADVKLIGGYLGNGYIGFSNINSTNSVAVSDSVEVLHSQGGWQLANNYFGGNGTGKMNTILFQYQFSLAAFLLRPQQWWGDGSDLVATVFGMYNSITTDSVPQNGGGKSRFKTGADVIYSPLPFIGFGGRFDLVQPDLDNSAKSFAVISPRVVLKTNYVTHEQVIIQYSAYSYNSEVQLPFPFDQYGPYPAMAGQRDKGVLTISASMWW
ncbi:MAG: hypothetical protein SF187_23880 [Deltaproteobacteria bacterium]|nr:hypothetical protein [Deltaproteobacteria bacterium]